MITKKTLDERLNQVAEATEWIEDENARGMILKIVYVHNKRLLQAIEHKIFARRTATVAEAEAALYDAERRLDAAFNTGVGVSAAQEAVNIARDRLSAAENVLLSKIDYDNENL